MDACRNILDSACLCEYNMSIILFLDKMVCKPFYCRMNILHRLWRQEQYYRLFLGGFAAMPLTSGIIKRLIRFIRNKYNNDKGSYLGLLEKAKC